MGMRKFAAREDEARRRKYKRLKLGGSQASDSSND
jgi:hypothetical protein